MSLGYILSGIVALYTKDLSDKGLKWLYERIMDNMYSKLEISNENYKTKTCLIKEIEKLNSNMSLISDDRNNISYTISYGTYKIKTEFGYITIEYTKDKIMLYKMVENGKDQSENLKKYLESIYNIHYSKETRHYTIYRKTMIGIMEYKKTDRD